MGLITLTLNELLDYMPDIGLEDYPIFDEAHRPVLNAKILNRYDAREIGFETGEMFSFALKRRMHEIMPYYNQLYASELLTLDPLKTLQMHSEDSSTSESSETSSGSSSTTSENSTTGKNVSYVMPQVALSGNQDYADSAADSESGGISTGSADNEGNSSNDASSTSTSDVSGFQGSQADLLARYRDTFLNIDVLVIENVSDLFLQVWNSGNAYYEEQHNTTPYGSIY